MRCPNTECHSTDIQSVAISFLEHLKLHAEAIVQPAHVVRVSPHRWRVVVAGDIHLGRPGEHLHPVMAWCPQTPPLSFNDAMAACEALRTADEDLTATALWKILKWALAQVQERADGALIQAPPPDWCWLHDADARVCKGQHAA